MSKSMHIMTSPMIGRVLRRARILRGIKQSHLAELMDVTQSTVSRWENGTLALSSHQMSQAQALLVDTETSASADSALKRLVETSSAKVHLICDRSHNLLASSPARRSEWRVDPEQHLGRSLIVYATPEILEAEAELTEIGWHDGAVSSIMLETGANDDPDFRILPSKMLWERIVLSDGEPVRLVTTLN